MSLIRVPQHRREDIAAWSAWEAEDRAYAGSQEHASKIRVALRALEDFADDDVYVSTSWGKDSVCVAHLAWTLHTMGGVALPITWVRVDPVANPHCVLVRDAFLARHPMAYHEQVMRTDRAEEAEGHDLHAGGKGVLDEGFRRAQQHLGRDRYVSGVRADESGDRRRRFREWGHSSPRTCAPLSAWSSRDVYAYMAMHDLPVHPSYAMCFGGRIHRDRIRVSSIGGQRGRGMGRSEWERAYYA